MREYWEGGKLWQNWDGVADELRAAYEQGKKDRN